MILFWLAGVMFTFAFATHGDKKDRTWYQILLIAILMLLFWPVYLGLEIREILENSQSD